MTTNEPFAPSVKLAKLREHMTKHGVQAYIVPSGDAHVSEIPVVADDRRRYISNFTGSAGTAVIAMGQAYLFTDGRYFLQAEQQLDPSCYTLMRAGTPDCPKMSDFIRDLNVSHVGFDPYLHTSAFLEEMNKALNDTETKMVPVHQGLLKEPAGGVEEGQLNLVDLVWEEEGTRPKYPSVPLTIHAKQYAGPSVSEKLEKVRKGIKKEDSEVLIISALDDIAYLYSIRGNDTVEAREFLAYSIITSTNAFLYLMNADAPGRLPEEVQTVLKEAGVEVKDYAKVGFDLTEQIKALDAEKKVFVDSNLNCAITMIAKEAAGDEKRVLVKTSPVALMKATKSPSEVQGMIDCHIQDGYAVVQFLRYLDFLPTEVLATLDEVDVSETLAGFRKVRPGYFKPSFTSISSVDSNGAIIHYNPKKPNAKKLNPRGMYLIDSGGHYLGGTTDVTRTIHMGIPSDFEKDLYTRVLMGHVDLARILFPPNKLHGCQLDILARRNLWAIGMDYRHGTGHGVGSSIHVHEGPPNISYRCPPVSIDVPFQAGMVVSNEPGCYIDGQFGIRIENLQVCQEKRTPHQFDGLTYLGFEQLTVVPYCRKLIKKDLLSKDQIQHIDSYHAYIRQVLTPLAGDDKAMVQYISDLCAPL